MVFCVPIWQVVGVILDSCGGVGMAWASLRQVELLQVLYFTLYLVYSVHIILFSNLNIEQILDKWKSCKYNSSLYIIHDMIYSISYTLFRTTLVQFQSWASGIVASTVHHSIWYSGSISRYIQINTSKVLVLGKWNSC